MEPPSDKHLDEAGDNLLKGGDKAEPGSQDKGHSVALALGGSGPLCLYLGAEQGGCCTEGINQKLLFCYFRKGNGRRHQGLNKGKRL